MRMPKRLVWLGITTTGSSERSVFDEAYCGTSTESGEETRRRSCKRLERVNCSIRWFLRFLQRMLLETHLNGHEDAPGIVLSHIQSRVGAFDAFSKYILGNAVDTIGRRH